VFRDETQLLKVGLTSEDARLFTTWHPNVVVVGTSQTTEAVLAALTPYLKAPVRHPEQSRSLPTVPQGSLILRALETFDGQEQRHLLHWLDGTGADTQVISLTSVPLYPRVEQGAFLGALYYRLNIVHLEPLPDS
jgi:hypothetical protein